MIFFYWHTPYKHIQEVPKDVPESSNARKRKTPVARVVTEDLSTTSSTTKAEEPPATQTTKRRRRYHVTTTKSDIQYLRSPLPFETHLAAPQLFFSFPCIYIFCL
ncbi:hypothetical protein V6N13_088839 [Hibiscus sabdariffa]